MNSLTITIGQLVLVISKDGKKGWNKQISIVILLTNGLLIVCLHPFFPSFYLSNKQALNDQW
jgi:hypothetical protein